LGLRERLDLCADIQPFLLPITQNRQVLNKVYYDISILDEMFLPPPLHKQPGLRVGGNEYMGRVSVSGRTLKKYS